MYINLFLTTTGLAAALHLICTATLLSTDSPLSVVLEVACGFAASVGVVITSIHGDQPRALMFSGALALCLILFSLEKALRGRTTIIRINPGPWSEHRRRTDQVNVKG